MFSYIKNTSGFARVEKYISEDPAEFLQLKQFSRHCYEAKRSKQRQFFDDNELSLIQQGLKELYGDMPDYFLYAMKSATS